VLTLKEAVAEPAVSDVQVGLPSEFVPLFEHPTTAFTVCVPVARHAVDRVSVMEHDGPEHG
jgi:hypothetical protein